MASLCCPPSPRQRNRRVDPAAVTGMVSRSSCWPTLLKPPRCATHSNQWFTTTLPHRLPQAHRNQPESQLCHHVFHGFQRRERCDPDVNPHPSPPFSQSRRSRHPSTQCEHTSNQRHCFLPERQRFSPLLRQMTCLAAGAGRGSKWLHRGEPSNEHPPIWQAAR